VNVLQDSVPSNGRTKRDDIDYFKYIINPSFMDSDIEISITPLTGDPNILVSWDPLITFPSMEDNQYNAISMQVGPDTIVVKPSDRFKKNPGCNPNL